ncbi:unnamed protein product, partial [Tetraodon nigroviridis]
MSRFSFTSAEDYLAKSSVLFYLGDAVTQLLEHKQEYTQFGLTRFFAEYFSSVKNGNHVLFREYSYIRATPHNRASFIRMFWRCYRQIGRSGDLLSALEYRSLLQLLCPDFPAEVVENAARMVLTEDAGDGLVSFSDFVYAFQLQFYYQEFLDSLLAIYKDLLAGRSPHAAVVPTASPEEESSPETWALAQGLQDLCERLGDSLPPRSCMLEVLEQTGRVSYYSFLMHLAKHEGLNQTVGVLPSQSELLVDPEMDQELEKLLSQISVSPGSTSSGSAVGLKEVQRRASPRRNLHHRRRMEVESDGSTEETDSSE